MPMEEGADPLMKIRDDILSVVRDQNEFTEIIERIDRLPDDEQIRLLSIFADIQFIAAEVILHIIISQYSNTTEFIDIFSKLFDEIGPYIMSLKDYNDFATKVREDKEESSNIVCEVMKSVNNSGTAAGILLSLLSDVHPAYILYQEGLSSDDSIRQRSSIIAIKFNIIQGHGKPEKWFQDLKEVKTVLQSNNDEYISTLQHCFEKEIPGAEDHLYDSIIDHVERSKIYIRINEIRQKVAERVLKAGIETLERNEPDAKEIILGLAVCYQMDRDYTLSRLESIINSRGWSRLLHHRLIFQIQQTDITPFIEFIEQLIDQGNSTIITIGDTILRQFLTPEELIKWCDTWKENSEKFPVVLKSIKSILSDNNRMYDTNPVKDQAINLVRYFADNQGIDYKTVTADIDLGSDRHPGKKNKENTLRTLKVIRLIQSPKEPIDIATLKRNIPLFPNVFSAIGEDWIIDNAKSESPHYFVSLYQETVEDPKELKKLFEKSQKETDDNRRLGMLIKYDIRSRIFLDQQYWENVFTILHNESIRIKRTELRNTFYYLSELDVTARLASDFDIEIEPIIPELGDNNLDLMVTSEGSSILVEVTAIHQKLEINLANGGTYIPGSQVKNKLMDKLSGQLSDGNISITIPIVIITHLQDSLDLYAVENGLYGMEGIRHNVDPSGRFIGHRPVRQDNGFFEEAGSEIISAVGAYKKDLFTQDTLEGRLYRPLYTPTNPIDPKLWVKFRDSLFGANESSDWKSLILVDDIDVSIAKSLHQYGIEELDTLATINPADYAIDEISQEKLEAFQVSAKRVISNILSGEELIFGNGND